MKARITGESGKKLISGKIRWYSDNTKVATVSQGGKLKFKKKGVCYIWAKAHNGENSRKIRVSVG
jgi:hypothetical protein